MTKISILQPWLPYEGSIPHEAECYLCHSMRDMERHHIFHGPNRDISEQDGCWVYLCHSCHSALHSLPSHLVVGGEDITVDEWLKRVCQVQWMNDNGKTREGFIARFGRSYA